MGFPLGIRCVISATNTRTRSAKKRVPRIPGSSFRPSIGVRSNAGQCSKRFQCGSVRDLSGIRTVLDGHIRLHLALPQTYRRGAGLSRHSGVCAPGLDASLAQALWLKVLCRYSATIPTFPTGFVWPGLTRKSRQTGRRIVPGLHG